MHGTIPHDAVTAATSLAPHIRAVREELETTRRVPLSLVRAINSQAAQAGDRQDALPKVHVGYRLVLWLPGRCVKMTVGKAGLRRSPPTPRPDTRLAEHLSKH